MWNTLCCDIQDLAELSYIVTVPRCFRWTHLSSYIIQNSAESEMNTPSSTYPINTIKRFAENTEGGYMKTGIKGVFWYEHHKYH